MQIPPPTPTYVPTAIPGSGPFEVSFTLWDAAPNAVAFWQWASAAGIALQTIILIVLVFVAIRMFLNFIKDMTKEDSNK